MVRVEPEAGCSVRVRRGPTKGSSDPAPSQLPATLDASRADYPPIERASQFTDNESPCFGPRVGPSDAERAVRIRVRTPHGLLGTGGPP
jgi:hypothetical protein